MRNLVSARGFLLSTRLEKLPAGIDAHPNLRKKVLVAVLIKDQPFAGFGIPRAINGRSPVSASGD
jgi:hypothetical protein